MKQNEKKLNTTNSVEAQLPTVEMRVNRLDLGDSHCLAHLSVTLGGVFAVRGLRLIEGKNGPFLNFPSYKSATGYQDICFPVSAQMRQKMTDAAVAAYQQVLNHHQAESVGKQEESPAKVQTTEEENQAEAVQEQAEPADPEPDLGIGMQM